MVGLGFVLLFGSDMETCCGVVLACWLFAAAATSSSSGRLWPPLRIVVV